MPPRPANLQDNDVTLFFDGSAAFRAMWEAIDGATWRVWLETYILGDDPVGRTTLAYATAAARRGCDVCILYDYAGSMRPPYDALAELEAAGGRVVVFHPLYGQFRAPWKWQWPLFRTHRKLLIVDETAAFCGGMNTQADYAGPEVGGNGTRGARRKTITPIVL